MDWLIDGLNSKIVTGIAGAASIISFILTIAVYVGIRKIKRFYLFNARMPELNDRLAMIASKISTHLNSGALSSDLLAETLADAEVTLKSLSRKVDNPLKSDIKKILNNVRSIENRDGPLGFMRRSMANKPTQDFHLEREERIRSIYVSLYKLNAECRDVYEDARWEQ